ncbi:restriction endonuclease [Streptomyces fulvorobeus]|uniref:Restriction endonuclease n=1 Tax=Streptomyces fulvorobeus TaxID=284028 RepID=A0A7J0CEX5_9ACTN|nr:restriction endonuclease [Streptomyces fulvorobeus]NYE43855.1 restriction system protein [Streptomyces fulvorobeus]GFN00345.1 restriction endonuclease [Streptomyces fulvorobeus]
MAIAARTGVAPHGRPAFSIRRTAVGFTLVALLLWGGGTALRAAWQSAGRHPAVAAVVVVLLVTGAVAVLRHRRSRRAALRTTAAVTEVTYDLVDTGLAEAAAALRPPQEATAPEPVEYAALDPYEFEEAIAGLCERDGCRDVEVVGGAGDLGADVVATARDGRRVVIQCKRYGSENKVGSQDVQRFGGTCYAVHEADVAIVVTTGEYTDPALGYADTCGILCVDHEALRAWSDGDAAPPWEAALPVDDAYGGR